MKKSLAYRFCAFFLAAAVAVTSVDMTAFAQEPESSQATDPIPSDPASGEGGSADNSSGDGNTTPGSTGDGVPANVDPEGTSGNSDPANEGAGEGAPSYGTTDGTSTDGTTGDGNASGDGNTEGDGTALRGALRGVQADNENLTYDLGVKNTVSTGGFTSTRAVITEDGALDYDQAPHFTYGDSIEFSFTNQKNDSDALEKVYCVSPLGWDDHGNVDLGFHTTVVENGSTVVLPAGEYGLFMKSSKTEDLGRSTDGTYAWPHFILRIVSATLSKPESAVWAEKGVASWSPVDKDMDGRTVNADMLRYNITLYKDGNPVGDTKHTDETSYNLTEDIEHFGYGNYTFTVTVSENDLHGHNLEESAAVTSSGYVYGDETAPVIKKYKANKDDQLEAKVSDAGSGIKRYAFTNKENISEITTGSATGINCWIDVDNAPGVEISATIALSDTRGGNIRFVAEDNSGNTVTSEAIPVSCLQLNNYFVNDNLTPHVTWYAGTYESISLPEANAMTRLGYSFEGWYFSDHKTQVDSVSIAENGTITPGNSLIIYAKWSFCGSIVDQSQDINVTYDGTEREISASVSEQTTYRAISWSWYKKHGDAWQATGDTTAAKTVKNVSDSGVYHAVATLTVSDDNGADKNIEIVSKDINVTINPRPLTLDVSHANIHYLDPVPTEFSYTLAQGQSLVEGDVLSDTTNGLSVSTDYHYGDSAKDTAYVIHGTTTVVGNYSVTVTDGNLMVEKRNLSDDDVTVELSEDKFTYDGLEKTPSVTSASISVSGQTYDLNSETDYDISYTDNVNAAKDDTAVVLELKGNFTGSVKKTFTIEKATYVASISMAKDKWTYGETAPVISVSDSHGTPVYHYKKGDTELSSMPKDAGAYSVWAVIPESDNYNSVQTEPVTFTIEKRKIEITADSREWTYDGNSHTAGTYKMTGTFAGQDAFKYVKVSGEITDVGEVDNTIESALTTSTKA
nr:hypothetical protein [Lachnospiraceae bacterium]